jgi:pimeloyl-ACP methyl ester carboxylesterase
LATPVHSLPAPNSTLRIGLVSLCSAAALLSASIFSSSAFAQADQVKDTPAPSLTVLDPYLLTIPANGSLPVSTVVAALAGNKDTAKGIMADGTSAAIVVYDSASSAKVTFSASNGAKVAAYNPAFLTSVSSPGSSSVTVTPTKIDSSYYSLALVTSGTAPDAEHGADTTVSAKAAGSSSTATFSMLTLPTPVVLVHGLWGHLSSLASTESYLKALPAFKSYPSLVTPICYSVYLAFDAPTDTLPGHGSGCEMTSEQALTQYFSSTLYKQLDDDHYVGGRVDAIVHSMGGLAARHYASHENSSYKSVRNRMLGAFRNVITLDTPETGSALATYLDDTAYDRTYKGSGLTEYYAWYGLCGSTSSSVTVESCFDKSGLPLSYPGQPLNTGAVYSLIPGGPSLTSSTLPAPGVFNTSYGKWFVIASNFKEGDQPPSLLRDVLNTVIAATYSSGAPTTDSILGTPDSDVVVTVASQTSTAVASQTAQFKDLEHTPAPSEASLLFPVDSNNSVVTSSAVNGQAAFWLGLQSSTAPAVESSLELQNGDGREDRPSGSAVRPAFTATGRLAVQAPEQPAKLGQLVRIPLRVFGPKIARIAVEEIDPATGREVSNEAANAAAGSGRAWVAGEDRGTPYIELVPLRTGSLGVRVQVVFADGGYAKTETTLNVVASQTGLERFDLDKGFHAISLVLEDKGEDREAALAPVAAYSTLRYPVYLENAAGLKVTVDQPEDDPVIRVDDDGLVHALRPGTAVIAGDLDGVTDSVRVEVYSKDSAPVGYRRGLN